MLSIKSIFSDCVETKEVETSTSDLIGAAEPVVEGPSDSGEAKFNSPQAKKKRYQRPSAMRSKSKYQCEKCQVLYQKDDKQMWLGCSHAGCDTWVHARCLNIIVQEGKNSSIFDYYCNKHLQLY